MSNEPKEMVGDWEIRFGDVPAFCGDEQPGVVRGPMWYAALGAHDAKLIWFEGDHLSFWDDDGEPSGHYQIPLAVIEALRSWESAARSTPERTVLSWAVPIPEFPAFLTRLTGLYPASAGAELEQATAELRAHILKLKVEAVEAWAAQTGVTPKVWLEHWEADHRTEPDPTDDAMLRVVVFAKVRGDSSHRTSRARVP